MAWATGEEVGPKGGVCIETATRLVIARRRRVAAAPV